MHVSFGLYLRATIVKIIPYYTYFKRIQPLISENTYQIIPDKCVLRTKGSPTPKKGVRISKSLDFI